MINLAWQKVLTLVLMGNQLSCDVTATIFFWLIKEGLREGEDCRLLLGALNELGMRTKNDGSFRFDLFVPLPRGRLSWGALVWVKLSYLGFLPSSFCFLLLSEKTNSNAKGTS